MSSGKHDPLAGSWVEAVAARSGSPAAAVADFLDRHDVREASIIPRPVDLTVRRVAFGGEKQVGGATEPFDFEWRDLGPGLWLVGSDRNSCGKTSLFGVMRWLLRGFPPRSIPPDVLPGIRRAEMDFLLDGVPHRASVDLRAGYDASLSEVTPGRPPVDRIRANSPEAFADGVSDFMMRALDLFQVLGLRRDPDPGRGGLVTRHRWPALFGAFHVGTDYSALLGDTTVDALPNRMLNMFAGFPHAGAVAAISHVHKNLQIADEQEQRSRDAVSAHARATVDRLRAELARLTGGVPGQTVADLLAEMHRISEATAAIYARLAGLRQRAIDSADDVEAARRQHRADRLALRNFVEAGAAAAVFRALEPRCCPRCDRSFGTERREREQVAHVCMVCGDAAPTAPVEDADEVRSELERAEGLSRRIRAAAEEAEREARRAVEADEAELSRSMRQIEEARARHAAAGQDEATRARRSVVEAMIAELDRDVPTAVERPETEEVAIAKACEAVFRARLKSEQEGVLKDVEAEVLDLLRAFGVPNLAAVRLTSHPQLKLARGKVEVGYSELSVGEQLRCKIALVLALMKVARRRDVGRHPGILFIDTPGAQELSDGDLEAMAAGLVALCDELPSLQVFVATRHIAQFEAAVPEARRLVAPPGGTVW